MSTGACFLLLYSVVLLPPELPELQVHTPASRPQQISSSSAAVDSCLIECAEPGRRRRHGYSPALLDQPRVAAAAVARLCPYSGGSHVAADGSSEHTWQALQRGTLLRFPASIYGLGVCESASARAGAWCTAFAQLGMAPAEEGEADGSSTHTGLAALLQAMHLSAFHPYVAAFAGPDAFVTEEGIVQSCGRLFLHVGCGGEDGPAEYRSEGSVWRMLGHRVYNYVSPPSVHHVPGTLVVLLEMWGENYSHKLQHVIPRLVQLPNVTALLADESVHFLISSNLANDYPNFLHLLGVPLHRILPFVTPQHPRPSRVVYSADTVVVPAAPPCGLPQPAMNVEFAHMIRTAAGLRSLHGVAPRDPVRAYGHQCRDTLQEHRGGDQRPVVLVVDRGEGKYRGITPFDPFVAALRAALPRCLVAPFRPLSALATACIWGSTAAVVAPHGAGLANMMFLDSTRVPKPAVVELVPEELPNFTFWYQAQVLGLGYAPLVVPGSSHMAPLEVSPDQAADIAQAIVARVASIAQTCT